MEKRQRPKKRYHCTECGAEIAPRRAWRSGLCRDCAAERQRENLEQLRAKKGPYYEKWLAAWKAGLSRQLGEAQDAQPSSKP